MRTLAEIQNQILREVEEMQTNMLEHALKPPPKTQLETMLWGRIHAEQLADIGEALLRIISMLESSRADDSESNPS